MYPQKSEARVSLHQGASLIKEQYKLELEKNKAKNQYMTLASASKPPRSKPSVKTLLRHDTEPDEISI